MTEIVFEFTEIKKCKTDIKKAPSLFYPITL